MLESNKIKFSELLKRINSTKIDAITNEADVERFYSQIKDEYYNIQCDILKKRENLIVVSSILGGYYFNNNSEENYNDDIKFLIDSTIGAVNNLLVCEIQEKLIRFNIEKGKWFFERGQYNKAMDAWEEVLKVNPDHEYIHSKLNEMISNYGK